ncbi:MAG: hypothetical protein WAO61_04105 [Solirubrobacterales bacterium]
MNVERFEPHSRVRLPEGVQPPYGVYVNGIEQADGVDYRVEGRYLLFRAGLKREAPLGFWRWLTMFIGIMGTYRRNDGVDVTFRRDDKMLIKTALPIETLVESADEGPLAGPVSFDPTRR